MLAKLPRNAVDNIGAGDEVPHDLDVGVLLRLADVTAGLHLTQRHVQADLLQSVTRTLSIQISIFLVHFVRFFAIKWLLRGAEGLRVEELRHLVTLFGVLSMHDRDIGVELRADLATKLNVAVENLELSGLGQQVAPPSILGVQRVQIANERAFLA